MERRQGDRRGRRQEGCRLVLGRRPGHRQRGLGRLRGWGGRRGCRRGLGGRFIVRGEEGREEGERGGWEGGWEFRWDGGRAWMAFFCYGGVVCVYYPACLHQIYFAEMDLGREKIGGDVKGRGGEGGSVGMWIGDRWMEWMNYSHRIVSCWFVLCWCLVVLPSPFSTPPASGILSRCGWGSV